MTAVAAVGSKSGFTCEGGGGGGEIEGGSREREGGSREKETGRKGGRRSESQREGRWRECETRGGGGGGGGEKRAGAMCTLPLLASFPPIITHPI